jgi:hypothetical protein
MRTIKLFLSMAFVMSFCFIQAQPFFIEDEPSKDGYTVKFDHGNGYWEKIYSDNRKEKVPVPTDAEFTEDEAARLVHGEEVVKVKRSAGYFSWSLKPPFLRTYVLEYRTSYRIRGDIVEKKGLPKQSVWCCPYVAIMLVLFVVVAAVITAISLKWEHAMSSFGFVTISYLAGMTSIANLSYAILFAGIAVVIIGALIQNLDITATGILSLLAGVLSLRTAEDHTGPLVAMLCLFGVMILTRMVFNRWLSDYFVLARGLTHEEEA